MYLHVNPDPTRTLTPNLHPEQSPPCTASARMRSGRWTRSATLVTGTEGGGAQTDAPWGGDDSKDGAVAPPTPTQETASATEGGEEEQRSSG